MLNLQIKAIGMIFILLLADQISKHYITSTMLLGQSVELIPSLGLFYTHNTGIAFSLLSGASGLGCISVVAAGYFYYLLVLNQYPYLRWPLIFLIAGSLGNGIDRITSGYVIDFIHVYYENWHFAIFNFADMFICFGVALWLLQEHLRTKPV